MPCLRRRALSKGLRSGYWPPEWVGHCLLYRAKIEPHRRKGRRRQGSPRLPLSFFALRPWPMYPVLPPSILERPRALDFVFAEGLSPPILQSVCFVSRLFGSVDECLL